MRYLAEAVWYPTALFPGQGVQWKAVNDSSAFGTLTDGDVSITLLFTFGKDGLFDRNGAHGGAWSDGRRRNSAYPMVRTVLELSGAERDAGS